MQQVNRGSTYKLPTFDLQDIVICIKHLPTNILVYTTNKVDLLPDLQ
jgi:hypothetical protein